MTETRHSIFENRADAGRRLALSLERFAGSGAIIMAIPRGGAPVAAAAAEVLNLEWNVIVTRKLPIPWNPEAGFGAVAADGSVALNDRMLHGLRLRAEQIDKVVEQVRAEVARRTEVYSRLRARPDLSERVVIVLDDGLASGYTMLAAIKSIRAQKASKVVAAAPVASKSAATLIEGTADECVFEVISSSVPFAVADFYLQWRDLTDDDVARALGLET
ncbi:MAG: phosphoribosyltransferase [Armatimonadetes bacterium]|nr:phosphoribosyltransferase [Armatimonadota bacterium]